MTNATATKRPPRSTTVTRTVEKSKTTTSIRSYKAALSFLFSNTNYETAKRVRYNEDTFNLNRMNRLLKSLGNPQKDLPAVHIAGTKGKGSTCTMLAGMLQNCGFKTGLYTSPHVLDIRERININGRMISEAAMTRLIRQIVPVVEDMKSDPPTFFEIFTAMAFLHFQAQKVDIAVVETGLGGRLDSTNVIKPHAIGITSISIDHQRQLGQTIAQIAKEKAGIFKSGVQAVSVMQDPEVMRVLRKEAGAAGTTLRFTGKDIDYSCRFESSRELGPHNRICLTTATSKYEHLPVPVLGEHQAVNCGLALSLLDCLKLAGFQIDDAKAIEGLQKTKLPGRMEIIHRHPRVLVDGAHNAASIRALVQATGQHIPYDSMVMIFGCCEDKDIRGMLEQLQYGADKVIFTRANFPRAIQPEDLAQMYTDISGKMCMTAHNLREALRIAKPAVGTEDIICITGSFYLVGEAKQMFMNGNPPL